MFWGDLIIFLFSFFFVSDLGSILTQTGWVARVVLALLFVFSLFSWALIFQKLGLFGRVRRESDQFLRIFRATKGVANPQALSSAGSPFWRVYAAGFRELQSQVGTGNPHPAKLKSVQAVTVSMQLAAAEEVRRTEKGMAWLATTGSVTPFIGLFGTVWGVMDAFSGDSVPVHLLTREAFAIYFRHLKPDGVLAVNISNRHLNFKPVVESAASDFR